MGIDYYDNSEPVRPDAPRAPRPYVSIFFECCGVYVRVYRPVEQAFYEGRCPKCLAPVRLRVGPTGTRSRFFRAY